MNDQIGGYAYLAGVFVALIAAVLIAWTNIIPVTIVGAVYALLVLFGLIVGFLNIADKEVKDFLLISAVLVFVSGSAWEKFGHLNLQGIPLLNVLGTFFREFLVLLIIFIVPAVVVVSLKAILETAKK